MYHSNLSRIGFNNFAKSVGPCELIRVVRAPSLLISTIVRILYIFVDYNIHIQYSLPFAICCAITVINASVVFSYLRTKRKDRVRIIRDEVKNLKAFSETARAIAVPTAAPTG